MAACMRLRTSRSSVRTNDGVWGWLERDTWRPRIRQRQWLRRQRLSPPGWRGRRRLVPGGEQDGDDDPGGDEDDADDGQELPVIQTPFGTVAGGALVAALFAVET
jgi:hypothetical protein